MNIETISTCRICGNSALIPIMDLGEHALSGRFPAKHEPDPPKAPLVLVKCDTRSNTDACGLVQLKHTVSHEELYCHHYGYRSGLNKTMTTHLQNLVKEIESRMVIGPGDTILDIGSNDATLLKSYAATELVKLGIDPTGKQFQQYYTSDIALVPDFFTLENFKKLSPEGRAKVITSIAMFYDLPKPMTFVADIKAALHPAGLWVFEQSYLPFMLDTTSFDTICHEHLEYYTLKQIEWMMLKQGLRIIDVGFNDINGGSFRITACHAHGPHVSNTQKIKEIVQQEQKLELETLKPYDAFKQRVEHVKEEIKAYVHSEKQKGKSTYIYGASTKGNTLLQYLGFDNALITAAAERNPEKFGRRTPATNIPIISEAEARAAKPDNFIVLPWHFKKEFLEREKEYLASGGKFIFPLPQFEVVGNEPNGNAAVRQEMLP